MFLSLMHSEGLAGETEAFVRYGVNSRLEVGFGYLNKQQTVRPLASYTLLRETATRPALSTGLMFDSLGGGRQGAFLSLSKDLQGLNATRRLPVSVYLGAAQITNEGRPRLLGGMNVRIGRGVNASLQYDGRYANLGVTSEIGRVNGTPVRFGLVAARGNRPGPLVATSFPVRP